MRPTIQQIADELGLSRTSVYKAIKHQEGISDEKRKLVLDRLASYGVQVPEQAPLNMRQAPLKVGFVTFTPTIYENPNLEYLEMIKAGLRQAEEKYANLDIEILFDAPESSESIQQEKSILHMLDQGAEGLALMPYDLIKLEPLVDKLVDQGIPVITVNRDIPTSKRIAHIGCNYRKSGMIAANIMGKLVKQGKVGMLLGNSLDGIFSDMSERAAGFRQIIQNYPDIELLAPYKTANTKDLESYLRKLIRNENGLKGIIDVNCSLETAGAIIQEEGKQHEISLVGFDRTTDLTEQYMRKQIIDAIVYQDIVHESKKSISLLVNKLVFGIEIPHHTLETRIEIILEQNFDQFRF